MSPPTTRTAAPAHIAGTSPSTNACGVSNPPAPVKTAASTATPSTPPSSRTALFAPDAWPASSCRTAPSTAFAAGANTIAMPVPPSTKAGTSKPYATSGSETAAIHMIAIACRNRPVAISGREPNRSERIPAIGATSIGMPVHGSVRSPASSGE